MENVKYKEYLFECGCIQTPSLDWLLSNWRTALQPLAIPVSFYKGSYLWYKTFLTSHLFSYLHRTFQFTCSKEISEKWASIKGCPLCRTASEYLQVHSLSGSNGSSKLQCKNQGRVNIKDEAFISGRFERSGRESDGKEIGHKICELLNTQADDDHGGMFPSLRADLQRPGADSDQVRQSKTLWTP